MQLIFDKRAAKRLRQLSLKQQSAVIARLRAISANPFVVHPNVKALRGNPGCFRLRVGDWRAVYRLDTASDTMRVTRFEPRGSVY